MAYVESHRLIFERRGRILARLRDELRGTTEPGASAVDELTAERRAEARREAAEHERSRLRRRVLVAAGNRSKSVQKRFTVVE